jgi:hypothetical protein
LFTPDEGKWDQRGVGYQSVRPKSTLFDSLMCNISIKFHYETKGGFYFAKLPNFTKSFLVLLSAILITHLFDLKAGPDKFKMRMTANKL